MLTIREILQLKVDSASYIVYANADLNGQQALRKRLANKGAWKYIAYKGESNSGALNFSTWLADAAGNSYCLATTWNTHQTIH